MAVVNTIGHGGIGRQRCIARHFVNKATGYAGPSMKKEQGQTDKEKKCRGRRQCRKKLENK
jgi:hypothetical protein